MLKDSIHTEDCMLRATGGVAISNQFCTGFISQTPRRWPLLLYTPCKVQHQVNIQILDFSCTRHIFFLSILHFSSTSPLSFAVLPLQAVFVSLWLSACLLVLPPLLCTLSLSSSLASPSSPGLGVLAHKGTNPHLTYTIQTTVSFWTREFQCRYLFQSQTVIELPHWDQKVVGFYHRDSDGPKSFV